MLCVSNWLRSDCTVLIVRAMCLTLPTSSMSRYNSAAVNTIYDNVRPATLLGGGLAASEADSNMAALLAERMQVQQVRFMKEVALSLCAAVERLLLACFTIWICSM